VVEEVDETKATVAEIDNLRGELKMLEGVSGWSEPQVISQAAKTFKRQIEKLADLRSSEAAAILQAAQKARAS
jgi:ABC-type proline/glycine betaine transport system substrate-binding protein